MSRKRSRLPRSLVSDRGAGTLELVVVFPVVLLLIFTIIQAALFYHAKNVALAAAQEGVRAATAFQASGSAGSTRARGFLGTAGAGALKSPRVRQERRNRQVTVTVSGSAPSIVPGVDLAVRQTATGPQERFTG